MHKLELFKAEMIGKIKTRLPEWSDVSSGAEYKTESVQKARIGKMDRERIGAAAPRVRSWDERQRYLPSSAYLPAPME
jgi:hypothetical protein